MRRFRRIEPDAASRLSALCDDPIVVACAVEAVSASLTVGAGASAADVHAFLGRVHAAAAADDDIGEVSLVQRAPDAMTPDPDMSTPRLWSLTAYPGELADADARLTEMLAVAAVPGTFGITSDAWPHVDIADIDRFPEVFRAVAALPLFANGGSYRLASTDERLRIEHTPAWVTPAFVDDVIGIAAAFPDAEVLLEAPAGGGEPPALYVSHLAPDEIPVVAQRLNAAPTPVPDSAPGVRIPYTLGTVGTDGVTYTNGDVGAAP